MIIYICMVYIILYIIYTYIYIYIYNSCWPSHNEYRHSTDDSRCNIHIAHHSANQDSLEIEASNCVTI